MYKSPFALLKARLFTIAHHTQGEVRATWIERYGGADAMLEWVHGLAHEAYEEAIQQERKDIIRTYKPVNQRLEQAKKWYDAGHPGGRRGPGEPYSIYPFPEMAIPSWADPDWERYLPCTPVEERRGTGEDRRGRVRLAPFVALEVI